MTLRSYGALLGPDEVLSSRPTTTAYAVGEAHETISRLFCEHDLSPLERREVRMRLRSAHQSGVGIELLDYGEAVRISVDGGLENFYLVQIPLKGRATLDVGNALVESSPLIATVPPIDRSFSMRWGAGTPTLIVYVERERLRAMAQSVYLVDAERLDLGLQMRLDTREGADFLRAVIDFHEVLERTTVGGEYARKLSADLLCARLLGAVDNAVSRSLDVWQSPQGFSAPRGDLLARRFETAAEAAAEQGVSVVDIAQQLGVPLRTLQEHVRIATGSTPTAILREARLRKARALLLDGDPTRITITSIAERSGFTHLGRFASDYRKRYGETPTETLRS